MKEFPHHLLLHEPQRGRTLLREFYEEHHRNRNYAEAKDASKKLEFFRRVLGESPLPPNPCGVDLGCRGGVLASQLSALQWVGVDIDHVAVGLAAAKGIPCVEMDISVAIDFRDESFDAVLLTEVLEHLPHPALTVREVHRILKKDGVGLFLGSVPLDYHLHRRFHVMRGGRLTGDPTHIHHFSFRELDKLLRHYFEEVRYCPTRGTASRFLKKILSHQHFVRDISWAAWRPKRQPEPWRIQTLKD